MEWTWLIVPVAYMVGTFPSAHLVGWWTGHDARREGSGNPGASNMFRVAGRWPGAWVLAGDLLKGIVPAVVGLLVEGRPLAVACVAAAVLGHIFPLFRWFRGGKGVATLGGGMMVTNPFASLGLILVWVVLVRGFKRASVGSLVVVPAVPIAVAIRGRDLWEIAVFAALAAVVVARHYNNIRRLLRRDENKMLR